MAEAIGIRLEKDMLKKIRALEKKEALDRSTVIRRLILIGYKNLIIMNAAQDYMGGEITMSEAARRAETTLWEMEKFLVEHGFKSSYSIEDLQTELERLR